MTESAADDAVRVSTNWNPGMPLSSPARSVTVAIDDSGYYLSREGVDDLVARLVAAREQTWPAEGPVSRLLRSELPGGDGGYGEAPAGTGA